MNRVDDLDPLMLGRQHESLRVINDELDEQRRVLELGIKRSRFLSHARRASRGLSIGGVGVAAHAAGPAGVVAAAGAGLLWDYVADRRDKRHSSSVLRHYLLFTS